MLDPRHTITIGGKEYVITPPNLATEDSFTYYLKKTAAADVASMADAWGQKFGEAAKAVQEAITTGYYDWFADGFLKCISNDKHFMKLAELVLNQETAIPPEVLKKHWKDRDGSDTITTPEGKVETLSKAQMLFSKIWEYINRPNSQGPAQ